MTTTVIFSELGTSLGTRNLGSKTRNVIIEKINNNEKVFLDFEGVDVVTNSFADECFRKLREMISTETFKSKIAFLNTNDFVQRVIISSL